MGALPGALQFRFGPFHRAGTLTRVATHGLGRVGIRRLTGFPSNASPIRLQEAPRRTLPSGENYNLRSSVATQPCYGVDSSAAVAAGRRRQSNSR